MILVRGGAIRYQTSIPPAISLAKTPFNRRRRPRSPNGHRPIFWLLITVAPAAVLILLALIFPEVWNSGALGMLVKGGIFMCPILLLGIPAFNYFTSIINQFVQEVKTSASELIEAVTLQMTLNKEK